MYVPAEWFWPVRAPSPSFFPWQLSQRPLYSERGTFEWQVAVKGLFCWNTCKIISLVDSENSRGAERWVYMPQTQQLVTIKRSDWVNWWPKRLLSLHRKNPPIQQKHHTTLAGFFFFCYLHQIKKGRNENSWNTCQEINLKNLAFRESCPALNIVSFRKRTRVYISK